MKTIKEVNSEFISFMDKLISDIKEGKIIVSDFELEKHYNQTCIDGLTISAMDTKFRTLVIHYLILED